MSQPDPLSTRCCFTTNIMPFVHISLPCARHRPCVPVNSLVGLLIIPFVCIAQKKWTYNYLFYSSLFFSKQWAEKLFTCDLFPGCLFHQILTHTDDDFPQPADPPSHEQNETKDKKNKHQRNGEKYVCSIMDSISLGMHAFIYGHVPVILSFHSGMVEGKKWKIEKQTGKQYSF